MKSRNNIRIILLLLMVALSVGCDQASKKIVREKVAEHETISIIKNHFILTKVENTGAFLSAGNELPDTVRFILLTLLPVIVLCYGLGYLLYKQRLPTLMQVGLCLLLGGGIGNVYDRIRFGSVTDFLHIDFGLFRTGVFNLADVSIMLGIGLLLLYSFKKAPLDKNDLRSLKTS
ncbi:MAG: signal peptidase II [Pedobacter sp.]|nr:signal peptidase II [Pedobacter sp.]MDQ8053630.1 signal peptidase II [Pedobacter sp.]